MDEETFSEKLETGEVEITGGEEPETPAGPGVEADGEEVDIKQYVPFLEKLKNLLQHVTAAPTDTPQGFLSQFRFYLSGGVYRVYMNIDKVWKKIYDSAVPASVFTSRISTAQIADAQSIPTASGTRVSLETEEFDGLGEFDSSLVTGNATATTADKLVDSGAFTEAAAYYVGRAVMNTTDKTYAVVTAKDSDDQLSIDTDIMASGEAYLLFFSRFTATVTGYYIVTAGLGWTATAAGDVDKTFWMYVKRSGTTVIWNLVHTSHQSVIHNTASKVIYMTAGQYLEVHAYQQTGAVVALRNAVSSTYLTVHRLS